MSRSLAVDRHHHHWHFYRLLDWPLSSHTPWCLAAVVAMLALATTIVYHTGGTAYAYPYLILIPVLFAAAWWGLAGGLLCALAAGGLMAAMPLDVAEGVAQSTFNWLLRLGLYLVIGGTAGWLFQSLRRAFDERQAIVRTDPRSGLPNQVALEEDMNLWWQRPASRYGRLALVVVRMTDMTDVLEAMGADASDELASRVGTRLQHLVRGSGRVYRFSVSELAVVLKGVDDRQLADFARRIAEAGEENLLVQSLPVRVQLVLGASVSTEQTGAVDDLISEARIALFTAIERRVGYCRFSPEFKQQTRETIRLIARVREGLDRHEFELHYQPKVRIADGTLAGCECLLRWRDSTDHLIPPNHFMPKVENTTLITPVTEFVSQRGCEFLREFGRSTSLNFSARNLTDERLLRFVERLVNSCGTDPSLLEIEITESALIQNLDMARRSIEALRRAGFQVSIDDFGTGFASFDYLRRLPITGIKIDRAFVSDIETSERARKLLHCMIDMGHALDLSVTAEGVETAGQYRILRNFGCDLAQGFYLTPALPRDAFLQWCERYRPIV